MIAIVPGYISRSVAGSYDNEGIAIFCMLFTYYAWIKSIKTGSIYWSAICSLAYFYMVIIVCLLFLQKRCNCQWTPHSDSLFTVMIQGFFMGWIRISHQSYSSSRFHSDDNWEIYGEDLRLLQHRVYSWHNPLDANPVCWISANSKLRAHASTLTVYYL